MALDEAQMLAEGHGAIQVGLPDKKPLMVVLGGPIKHWWQPGQWDTPEHQAYIRHRDLIRVLLVKSGFLVYSPHRAWQGAWGDDAQLVNDRAIQVADVFVNLGDGTIPADGTKEEIHLAHKFNTLVINCSFRDSMGNAQKLLDELNELARKIERARI